MKHTKIDQEFKWGIEGEDVGSSRYHMGEDNMGTNLKMENQGKLMPIKSMVKIGEKNMVRCRGNYYGDQGGNGGQDIGINSIKNNLPPFTRECNPDAYLEWESLCERIFQVNDLTKVKKCCFAIAQFEGFAITWWEYMKKYLCNSPMNYR
ncbi:hypothetical protein KY285_016175 [Solanum tuberosum]|nr:hypothetical protein KY285_016175 [Solanum tuberosum]